MPGRLFGALVIAGALAVGAACGSETPQAKTEPPVDLAQLDVGGFATQPRPLGKVHNQDQARVVEAERLANFVPLPAEIDPRFVERSPFVGAVFLDPRSSLGKIMAVDRFAEVAPDFVAGFTSTASTERDNMGIDLLNSILIFPDEQKATAAAEALERADFEAGATNEPVTIPKYPAAHAHWQPTKQSIGSFFATGRYVIYTWIYDYMKIFLAKVDQPTLTALVEKSLDKIVPAIAKFPGTPVDKLMDAELDRDGMLARNLQRPSDDSFTEPPGAYDAKVAALVTTPYDKVRKAIDEYGADKISLDAVQVWRARDAESAEKLRADLGGLTKKYRSAPGPRNLPAGHCREYIGREKLAFRFYCSVSYGRYAAFSWSQQLTDAQQRISAEYVVLVNAK
ncbi:hypothetical protein [Nocardia sp. NPDC052566]|uniref:DUF7373 family lipoprotein n=1 Tax=Nocardia sp. NPDC052566 TaxID=3364330 RepID=UPI0037CCBCBA